ncbi:MAG: TrpR-related protein YerC/YecD [Oscillospiraceae bacterium]|nr:TrpR-related protein YerC/YecD [Oscillospiraceae bacterium]
MTIRSESIDRLFDTFLNLKSREECYAYFEDLCTVKELQDMAQRLDTAILLSKGESYQNISRSVGMSTATIGRVSKCLNYGAGGYATAISRIEEAKENM